MRKTVIAILSFILIISLFITSCTSTSQTTSEAPKTLKIGCLITMSGPGSEVFSVVNEGMVICTKWINDKGGITVNGEKYLIDFVTEDDQNSTEAAVAGANKLVYQHEVDYILGPVIANLAQATADITESNEVMRLLIRCIAVPGLIGPEYPYTFATTDVLPYAVIAYDYLEETYPGVENVAMVCCQEPGALSAIEYSKDIVASRGMNTVFEESFPFGTTDFYSLWGRILAANPDAINTAGVMAGSEGPFVKQGRELGYTGIIFSTMSIGYPDVFLDAAGADTTDFFSLDLYVDSPDAPDMIKQIAQMVLTEYGKPACADHVYGFEAMWYLVQAIEAANSLDSTVVAQTLENMTSIQTPMGEGYLGGESTWGITHVIVHPEPIFTVMNGIMKQEKWVTPNVP